MHDPGTFEQRLADAFARYADVAPAADDWTPRSTAVARPRWRRGLRAPMSMRLVVVGLLLLAALAIVAVVGALRRDDTPLPPGRNGAVVVTTQLRDHAGQVTYRLGAGMSGVRETVSTFCPVYSGDGRTVASMASDEPETDLIVSAADGSSVHRVPIVPDFSNNVFQPSYDLAPDGSQVAWLKPFMRPIGSDGSVAVGQHELWVTDVERGIASMIVSRSENALEIYGPPVWSPDGRSIAFSGWIPDTTEHGGHRSAIYVVDSDGSNLRSLTERPASTRGDYAWSPDARYLAYVGLPDGASERAADDVFVIAADGTGDRNVTSSASIERSPAWSPDGTMLAFGVPGDGEAFQVSTIQMNGAAPASPAVHGPVASWFAWSADATALLITEPGEEATQSIRTIGRNLDPSTLSRATSFDGTILCPPAWQRLEP